MNIVLLRATDVNPDSRVEKETYSLSKYGHTVRVLGWDRSDNHQPLSGMISIYGQNTPIIRFGIKSIYGAGKKNLLALLKFQKCMFVWLMKNRRQYECIHACDFNTAFTGYIASVCLGKKFVYDIFDYFVDAFPVPKKLRKIIEWLDSYIIHHANAVIICTEQRKKQIKYHGKEEKLCIVHNSPMKITLPLKRNVKSNRIRVVYVGVLQPDRYIEELLDVVAKNKEYELHIGGFGILEDLVKSKAKKHVNIIYYGKLPYEKTLELENSADIMTALYKYNNAHKYAAPNKFYEAFMLGKPVIMAKETGMDGIVYDNKIGKVVGRDAISLEDALEQLKNEKYRWEEMTAKMQSLYRQKYSWSIMEKRLVKLYDSL